LTSCVVAVAAAAALAAVLAPTPAQAITGNVEATSMDCNPGADGASLTPVAHVTRHFGSSPNVSVVMMLLDGGVQIAQRGAGTQSVPVGTTRLFQVLAAFTGLSPNHAYTVRVRMADSTSGDFAFDEFVCQTASALLDTDGDGFSDAIETGYASDLLDPASTPVVPAGMIVDPMNAEEPEVNCGVQANGIDTCKLRPGDVYVWRHTGAKATLEEELGSTYFSHMGIVVGRWATSSASPQLEVVLADVTPGRVLSSKKAEMAFTAAGGTDLSQGPPDGPVAVGVYRAGALTLSAREAAARFAMNTVLAHGAGDNQLPSGDWPAPDGSYSLDPFAFGPDGFYCSSFVARAFGLVRNPEADWNPSLIWPFSVTALVADLALELAQSHLTPDDMLAWLPGRAAVTTFGKQKGGVISLLSPAHVLLTDPSGRLSGVDASGTTWDEIPEAVWRQTAVSESVSAPEIDGAWAVTLSGHAEGVYHLASRGVTDDAPTPAAVVPGFTRPGLVETFRVGELPALAHHPVAVDDAAGTSAGAPVDVDVLANDFDPDGDELSITGSSNGAGGTVTCAPAGVCRYTPQAGFSGSDTFTYTVSDGAGDDTGTVHVQVAPNAAPDCSALTSKPTTLWPPNHKLVAVSVSGATDADGDAVVLTVTGVTQDEPVNGLGDGDASPDARPGLVAGEVFLRAERSGGGNGRVYQVAISARDAKGGSCAGVVRVSVPRQAGSVATDSAPPSFASFGP
jgi:hypothetical protein